MANFTEITFAILRRATFALPVLAFAIALELSVTLPHAKTEVAQVYYTKNKLLWGDAYAITVGNAKNSPSGTFLGKDLKFFETAHGEHTAITTSPIDAPTGMQLVKISSSDSISQKAYYYPLVISEKYFKMTEFSVPKKMSHPGKAARERIKAERELVEKIKSERTRTTKKLWDGAFKMPLGGRVTDPFGAKRTVNKTLKYNHNGVDLRAKTGTRIFASNSGEVVVAKDFYLTGNTVIIDHGLGVFTTYAHLSKIKVKEGDKVEKGRLVGLAGATGRVTGSHLHFGATVDNSFVNPLSLIRVTRSIEKREVNTTPVTIE